MIKNWEKIDVLAFHFFLIIHSQPWFETQLADAQITAAGSDLAFHNFSQVTNTSRIMSPSNYATV